MMNNTVGNTTERGVEEELQWGYLAFIAILMVVCIVSNGVILCVSVIETTMRSQTNTFVISLACADLVLGIVGMPIWIARAFPHVDLSFHVTAIDLLISAASIFSCALLSLERALKITCPYWYTSTVTTCRVKIVICLGWITAFLVGVSSLLRKTDQNNIPYKSFITAVIYVIPVLAIATSYISIFAVARKHAHKIRRQNCQIASESRIRLEPDIKIAWRVGVFIAVFIICWTPLFISLWLQVPTHFKVVSCTLLYINATINPFLYAVANPSFRKGIRRLYARKRFLPNNTSVNKRMESLTGNTNVNNGHSSVGIISQRSPKPCRRNVPLLKEDCTEANSEQSPMCTPSTLADRPLLATESIWETNV